MPVEAYEDDDEEQEGPRSSFGTYLAEGDALFKQSEYKKALESYSLALELQPNDKACLVARSKCHLKLGDSQKALQDAEDALAEDKEFNKGLYRKAEALYCMGDFEYALMYYHRGHKLRPELDEFRLGIQKAQEAIDNSIGSAAKIKLENKGDLSFFTKQDDSLNKKRGGYMKPLAGGKKLKPLANRNKEVKPPAPSKKTVKQLLGELYSDKEYFEKLMEDQDFIKSRQNNAIYELVQGGLSYLETRTEFWRQQKPLYARKKDKVKYNVASKKHTNKPSVSKFVLKQLEEIDQALSSGNPDRSLRLAQKLLKSVEGIQQEDLPNKVEVIANVHSCIGNAYIEMDQLPKSLRHHEKDLHLSRDGKLTDGESRALDNVGRVHARMGNFKKAISAWNDKLPLLKASLESTWLFHEIGRCHLELGDFQKAQDFGKKSLAAGKDCEDQIWQLNATVLIAQSQVKLNKAHDAIETFSSALEVAVGLGDTSAQSAISKALIDLQRRSGRSGSGRSGASSAAASSGPSEEEKSPRVKSSLDDENVYQNADSKDGDPRINPALEADIAVGVEGSPRAVSQNSSLNDDTGDEMESDGIFENKQPEGGSDEHIHITLTESEDDFYRDNNRSRDNLGVNSPKAVLSSVNELAEETVAESNTAAREETPHNEKPSGEGGEADEAPRIEEAKVTADDTSTDDGTPRNEQAEATADDTSTDDGTPRNEQSDDTTAETSADDEIPRNEESEAIAADQLTSAEDDSQPHEESETTAADISADDYTAQTGDSETTAADISADDETPRNDESLTVDVSEAEVTLQNEESRGITETEEIASVKEDPSTEQLNSQSTNADEYTDLSQDLTEDVTSPTASIDNITSPIESTENVTTSENFSPPETETISPPAKTTAELSHVPDVDISSGGTNTKVAVSGGVTPGDTVPDTVEELPTPSVLNDPVLEAGKDTDEADPSKAAIDSTTQEIPQDNKSVELVDPVPTDISAKEVQI